MKRLSVFHYSAAFFILFLSCLAGQTVRYENGIKIVLKFIGKIGDNNEANKALMLQMPNSIAVDKD